MKLTPEKKALIEYGKAFFLMRSATQSMFWREESHSDIRREYIQDAWRKRAVCRVERNCSTCGRCVTEYTPWDEYESFCRVGIATLYITDTPDDFHCSYWEPRKEGV